MKRSVRLAAALSAVLSSIPPVSADPIQGYVLHGIDGRPMAAVEVALLARHEDHLGEVQRQATDPEGRFAFSNGFFTTTAAFGAGLRRFNVDAAPTAKGQPTAELREALAPSAAPGPPPAASAGAERAASATREASAVADPAAAAEVPAAGTAGDRFNEPMCANRT